MSVDGTWTITLKTPLGSQQATLQLITAGEQLSGTMQSRLGSGNLTNGRVSGNTLEWTATIKLPVPMAVAFNASVEGDAIAGTMDLGRIGKAPFQGVRS